MANINRNFGKLDEQGALTYAPRSLTIDGREVWNPRAETYAAAGYLPVDTASPSDPPREGYHYAPDGWEERDGAIRRVWREEANPPPPPRRWTRFAIKGALADARLLPAAKAFLGAYELKPDYTALEAFTDVDYIEEFYGGEETWSALLDGAAVALGKTREEIDAFLAAIPTEG
jgi:hypothetical protein